MSDKPSIRSATFAGMTAAIVAAPLVGYGAYRLYKHLDTTAKSNEEALAKAFNYDLTELRKVDPALIRYAEVQRIETGLQSPKGIALDASGRLLVAGDRVIRRFEADGSYSDIVALSQAPFCITVAPDGSIYVGVKDHVEVYADDGKPKSIWSGFGARSYITDVKIAGDHIYVADAGRRLLLHCDPAGKVLQEIGRPDASKNYPGLNVPSPHLDVEIASNGMVWVANPGMKRLEGYSAAGQLERTWGQAGTGIGDFWGCCNPTDFVMLTDGSFITAEKGIARIKRHHPDGRFDCVVAPPDAFAENLTGLDLDAAADGRVFAMERGGRAVRVFAPKPGGAS